MPDTGAPWNIPYVAPSDLVRDYPSDSEDLADAIALGLSAAGNPGIGSNVVSVLKTDVFTTSSSSYVDVTGLTITITPTSATSKILVLGTVTVGGELNQGSHAQLVRDSTPVFIGDAAGSRVRASVTHATNADAESGSIVFLDSPGVATAVTYKIQMRRGSSAPAHVNRSFTDSDSSVFARLASSLVAIEVAV